MTAKVGMLSMVPLAGLAQLDIAGFLTGPEGRSLGANLITSVLLDLLNALLSVFFQITV